MHLTSFDLPAFEESLKIAASTYIVRDEPIPSRMDLWRLNNHLCTIVLPQGTEESTEKIWSRVTFAPSLFGATHTVFSHKADIAVFSPQNPDAPAAECLCIYCASIVQVHQSIFPYTFSLEKETVDWQENAEGFNAIKEYAPLATFLSVSAVFSSSIGNPQRYYTLLMSKGYQVTFHEPFNEKNFAFFPSIFT